MVEIKMYVFLYSHLRNLTNWITENEMWEQQNDDRRKLTVWKWLRMAGFDISSME